MQFDGQSAVEVQPHINLDELKTVTSISLFIKVDPDKDPIEDRVILYLGDRNVRIQLWCFVLESTMLNKLLPLLTSETVC